MQTRQNINMIFQTRDLEKLNSNKVNRLQQDALQLVSSEIEKTNNTYKLLDLMEAIFWGNNHQNDLKLGRNIVGLWTYKDDTSALRLVLQQVKSKLLLFLNDDTKNAKFFDQTTVEQDWTLNELLGRKSSNHHFFCGETKLDKSFKTLLADKFAIKYSKTPGLK